MEKIIYLTYGQLVDLKRDRAINSLIDQFNQGVVISLNDEVLTLEKLEEMKNDTIVDELLAREENGELFTLTLTADETVPMQTPRVCAWFSIWCR